jgi:hypothetical protein
MMIRDSDILLNIVTGFFLRDVVGLCREHNFTVFVTRQDKGIYATPPDCTGRRLLVEVDRGIVTSATCG